MAGQQQKKKPELEKAKPNELVPANTETTGPDTTGLLERIDDALGNVRVTHGANDGEFQVAGKSVSSVRRSLKTAYNIPDDAQALVNGKVVDETHKLTQSSQLEFVKQSGTKGVK